MTNQNEPYDPDTNEEPELETLQGVVGFIATDPELRDTKRGAPRFYARFGVEHPQSSGTGQTTEREVTFHSIVAYREAARVAYAKFKKYDVFIAQGRMRINPHTGKVRFEAEHIGHDPLRTRYEVDRSARTSTPEPSGIDTGRPTAHADRTHGLGR